MGTGSSDRIDAITFDLDDTLLRYERSSGEVLDAAFEALGLESIFTVEEYYARFDEFARRCDSMDELRADCFAAPASENGHAPERGREVANVYSEERDQSNVTLLPGAERVLETVAPNYRVALVTNGAKDAQEEKIEAVGIGQYFDTAVFAGHETEPKPDPEAFTTALEDLGTTPARSIHVGNTLETDIAGATTAGLDSVWVSSRPDSGAYEPTYRIESLQELLAPPWEGE